MYINTTSNTMHFYTFSKRCNFILTQRCELYSSSSVTLHLIISVCKLCCLKDGSSGDKRKTTTRELEQRMPRILNLRWIATVIITGKLRVRVAASASVILGEITLRCILLKETNHTAPVTLRNC